MHLVQILLPVYRNDGQRMERSVLDGVAQELSERFGGVTLYARGPATGLWKEDSGKTARDDIVVCEIMVETLDTDWWQRYRQHLEQVFAQQELLIRAQQIQRL